MNKIYSYSYTNYVECSSMVVMISDEPKLQGVAQLMVRENLIDKTKALQYQALATTNKQSFIQFIVESRILTGKQVASFLGEKLGVSLFDLDAVELERLPIKVVSELLIRKHQCLPLCKRGNVLYVAVEDPSKELLLKDIQFATGLQIAYVVAESEKLKLRISQILRQSEVSAKETVGSEEGELAKLEMYSDEEIQGSVGSGVLGGTQDAPIVRFVNKIMFAAIDKRASDVHFEPYENFYRIRYRIDGVLLEVATPPIALTPRITARIKILSNLDISERRIPQDGRFNMKNQAGREVECRVSTCPTAYGEKVAIRLLDPAAINFDINTLGFDDEQKVLFLKNIHRPHGLIIVTGPTGSGKSLTLYNALNLLNTREVNICTVEDPVEMRLSGINQVNINPKAGLTFSTTLRSFLRQDPDIIMVGEIRDLETAEIAIASAQTGHLVLSTLHTNSAAESLTRLKNMGIPSYNIASSLNLLIAQRLVRLLCEECKSLRSDVAPQSLIELGFTQQEVEGLKLYKPEGCYQCTNGYKGRVALFEVLPVTQEVEQLIVTSASSIEINEKAQQAGMKSIYRSGLEKVKMGITTLEEVNRVAIESI